MRSGDGTSLERKKITKAFKVERDQNERTNERTTETEIRKKKHETKQEENSS